MGRTLRDRDRVAPRGTERERRVADPPMPRLLELQRTVGNAAVCALLMRRPEQRAATAMLQRVTTGDKLAADKALARAKFDPLLEKYMVGQALAGIKSESVNRLYQDFGARAVMGLEAGSDAYMLALAQSRALVQGFLESKEYAEGMRISQGLDMEASARFGPAFLTQLGYWKEKAARVSREGRAAFQGRVPLWCDQATALVIAGLAEDPAFHASLDVVKQGDPRGQGHWYVLANRAPERGVEYGRALEPTEFVIDLWGALAKQLPTVVHDQGPINLFEIKDLEVVYTASEKQGLDTLLADLKAGHDASAVAGAAPAGTDTDIEQLFAGM